MPDTYVKDVVCGREYIELIADDMDEEELIAFFCDILMDNLSDYA